MVYWSPHDTISNQRPRLIRDLESERYWEQWGEVHTVDTRGRRGPGPYGNHAFGAFFGANPEYRGIRTRIEDPPHRSAVRSEPRELGTNAPDPRFYLNVWMSDPTVDVMMVCHSQGCNIAMNVFNRGRTAKGGL